jgi:transposase
MGISWKAVDAIIGRVVERRLDPGRLDGLAFIGVDEFSYRKRHRYLTVVVSHDRQQVVWAAEGRSAETLKSFFDLLGPDRAKQIAYVTMDMSGGYIKAVQDAVPHAQIVFDRFHVQRLASDAVDEVRRSMVRLVRGTEEARAIKHTRFVLLKKPSNLTEPEKARLSLVQRTNQRLYRAYLLKETLASALNYRQPKRAENALRDWLSWASRSKLPAFVRAARTVRNYFDGVVAYVRTRLTNGLVEGINTRLRMVARRAFGFHSARALISMLFLTNGGIQLAPPLPSPTGT